MMTMRIFKSHETNEKRLALFKMFPQGKIRGMKISNMKANMIHAIYDSLKKSGIDMNSIYVRKKQPNKKEYLQYSLFDKNYNPLE